MTFQVSTPARDEIAGIAGYYNSRPGRYGTAFLGEIDVALAAIEAAPRMHPPADDGRPGCEDREYYISRFQQRVIYTIDGNDVLVLTVVHASRQHGRWHRTVP